MVTAGVIVARFYKGRDNWIVWHKILQGAAVSLTTSMSDFVSTASTIYNRFKMIPRVPHDT